MFYVVNKSTNSLSISIMKPLFILTTSSGLSIFACLLTKFILRTLLVENINLISGTMRFYGLWIITIFLVVAGGVGALEFNREYIGAVYQPYNRYGITFSQHTKEDVDGTLKLVATKFTKITTYGTGAGSNGRISGAVGYTATSAAVLNANNSTSLKLSVLVSAFRPDSDSNAHQREILLAFSESVKANDIYSTSVKGIILGAYYDAGDHALRELTGILTSRKLLAENSSLQLGIRTTQCEQLSNSDLTQSWDRILQDLNFIICHQMPVPDQADTEKIADAVSENFLKWRNGFHKINSKVEVIGETGWPSQGQSKELVVGSIESMKLFWTVMNKFATKNKFRIDIFTAFDDPWKNPTPEGELHYGWFLRIRNDTSQPEAFVEKIDYSEVIEGKSYALEVSLGIVAGLILFAIFGGMFFLYRKLLDVKSKLSKAEIYEFKHGVKSESGKDDIEGDALKLPYDTKYELAKNKLQIDKNKVLGSGQFGTVYRGKLVDSNEDVAIKLTQPSCSASTLKSTLSEIKIMIHVGKHENVVSILGAYTGDLRRGIVMIAIEMCNRGSLIEYLRSKRDAVPEYQNARYVLQNSASTNTDEQELKKNLLKWAYEISCGMEHISAKKVIHADLACRNVLLTDDLQAKITDFGLSRRLYEYTNYVKQNQEPLPWRWLSIESLRDLEFSTKSDIWSMGIVLWEIYSLGSVPYPGLSWTNDFVQQLQDGMRMNRPELATDEMYSIMGQCWHPIPNCRPEFTTLKDIFVKIIK